MTEHTRRQFIATSSRVATGLGLTAAIGAGLSGCASSPSRGGRLGAPLDDDPSVLDAGVRARAPRPSNSSGAWRPPARAQVPGYVIPRTTWSRFGPNVREADPMSGIDRITVHHDGMRPSFTSGADGWGRRLENIRRAHVASNGWADIGYHFAIDPEGRVWECRPLSLQGAHVRDQNRHNAGVLVLGNFQTQRPSGAAIGSLERLLTDLMQQHRVGVGSIHTHRELASTLCPGKNLQPVIDRVRTTRLASL